MRSRIRPETELVPSLRRERVLQGDPGAGGSLLRVRDPSRGLFVDQTLR